MGELLMKDPDDADSEEEEEDFDPERPLEEDEADLREMRSYRRGRRLCKGLNFGSFEVDDVLESKLERTFVLAMDEGTLDAIGHHPDGPVKRMMYWQSVARLVSPGGILVITSCSRTKVELVQEVDNFDQRKLGAMGSEGLPASDAAVFSYLDHVRSYPSVDSSCITTVALLHK